MSDSQDDVEPSYAERVRVYRAHLDRAPNDYEAWFDLGIALKLSNDWPACADANLRALRGGSEPGNPAWWNLGIAATGMRDWRTAREAWIGYGLKGIAEGDEPLQIAYGAQPVRLPNGEVVWGDRIDPARVHIKSIPFPQSGFRWGDFVLHDGAPNGRRESRGMVFSVFDVLERWSPSEIATLVVDVECRSDRDATILVELFDKNHFCAEDWTQSVRLLCAACSRGNPDGHDHGVARDGGEAHSFGIACPAGLATTLLDKWQSESPRTRRYAWGEVASLGNGESTPS